MIGGDRGYGVGPIRLKAFTLNCPDLTGLSRLNRTASIEVLLIGRRFPFRACTIPKMRVANVADEVLN